MAEESKHGSGRRTLQRARWGIVERPEWWSINWTGGWHVHRSRRGALDRSRWRAVDWSGWWPLDGPRRWAVDRTRRRTVDRAWRGDVNWPHAVL